MDSYDIEITQGSDFTLSLTLEDSNESPIDLTNYDVSGYLKFKYSDAEKLADLNATKLAPYASGNISLSIASSITQYLPITIGVYDIEINNSGVISKVLKGKVNIYPEVTF